MKRCPECRRDYYDDSLIYCLDDGTALLEGPATTDEPATAILGADTKIPTQILSADAGKSDTETPGVDSKRYSLVVGAVGIIVIMALGIGGYLYYDRGAASAQIESIAVLPFINESGDPDLEYLSDGMTESLMSSLSELPNLTVKARSSVFRYKGKETDIRKIGDELNVQAIVNGHVTQRGDQLALNIELVDTQTENLIWSKRYSRQQTDLIALQMEIGRDVAQKLKTKLSGTDAQNVAKNNTANTEAYQLYLRGRYHYNKFTDDGYYRGIEYFTQATAIDPNYALAYTGLADCYFGLSDQFRAPNEVMPKARAAAEKALSLDNSLAEAHVSLGLVKMFYDHAWTEAEGEFQRAIALDPNYANAHLFYSRLLMAVGRYDEAVREGEIAIRIEPLSPMSNAFLGYVLGFAGRSDEALAQFNRALELNDQFPMTHYYLGSIYTTRGELDKAAMAYEKAFKLNRNARYLMALGNVYAAAGQREKALDVLFQLTDMKKEQYISSYYSAAVYAGLNDKDQAFALLDKAFEEHSDSLAGLKYSPLMRNLDSDPRFKAIIRRAGLPE